jgi:protein-disulfide isomerase
MKYMSKQFLAVIAAVVIIFVGVLAISNHKSNSSVDTKDLTHHVEGEGKDGVTLTEYGDYECPYCGEYYSTIKQVVAIYNDQITFQFVNFPLVSIHPNALAGARAAEAAGLMGKYWQMHDLLYETNQVYYDSNETAASWISSGSPISYFDKFAKQLGLNVTTFNTDYNSNKVNDLINNDLNEGNKLGINATPTFYLDGKKMSPAPGNTVSAFQTAINAAIKQKTAAKSNINSSSTTTTDKKS